LSVLISSVVKVAHLYLHTLVSESGLPLVHEQLFGILKELIDHLLELMAGFISKVFDLMVRDSRLQNDLFGFLVVVCHLCLRVEGKSEPDIVIIFAVSECRQYVLTVIEEIGASSHELW